MKRLKRYLLFIFILSTVLFLYSCGGSLIITIGDYTILFVSNRDGDDEIYIAKPGTFGGWSVEKLTDNTVPDIAPTWGNDGRIAYFSLTGSNQYSLFTMNGDGSNKMRIHDFSNVSNVKQVSWNTSKSKIAIVYSDSSMMPHKYLYIYDMNSGIPTELERTSFGSIYLGGINPSSLYDEVLYHIGFLLYDIYTASFDGSVKTNLTNTNSEDEKYPCWNSIGSKIAYSYLSSNGYEIYIMDRDGSNKTQITNDTKDDIHPHWVGDKIVYEKDEDIYLSYFDGSTWHEKAIYTNSSTDEKYPKLSPDGKKVAFLSAPSCSDDWRIYVVNLDDEGNPIGSPVEVSDGTVKYYPPQWSPVLF